VKGSTRSASLKPNANCLTTVHDEVLWMSLLSSYVAVISNQGCKRNVALHLTYTHTPYVLPKGLEVMLFAT